MQCRTWKNFRTDRQFFSSSLMAIFYALAFGDELRVFSHFDLGLKMISSFWWLMQLDRLGDLWGSFIERLRPIDSVEIKFINKNKTFIWLYPIQDLLKINKLVSRTSKLTSFLQFWSEARTARMENGGEKVFWYQNEFFIRSFVCDVLITRQNTLLVLLYNTQFFYIFFHLA